MARARFGVAGRRERHGALADQLCSFFQIVRTQQRFHGNRSKGRIAEVARAVGVRELAGLGEKMQRRRRLRRRAREARALEQPEHLQHGDAARARRAHRADAPAAVRAAHRLALDGAVAPDVGLGQIAGLRVGAHREDHVLRDVSLVEHAGAAARDGAQGFGVLAVDDPIAGVIDLARRRVFTKKFLPLERLAQLGRSLEALVGDADRGAEELGPGQTPVALVRELEHAQHAGHADRAAADGGIEERERFSSFRNRSGFAAAGAVSRPS